MASIGPNPQGGGPPLRQPLASPAQPPASETPPASPLPPATPGSQSPPGAALPPGATLAAPLGMTVRETALFLRTLMQLPQDVREWLAMMTLPYAQHPDEATLKQLLSQLATLKIPPELLQEGLLAKLEAAQAKLLQQLQGPAAEPEQLKPLIDILNTLGRLSTQSKLSPADALQTTLLLYLPWLPISPQKLEVWFELPADHAQQEASGSEGEDSAEALLVLFIQTETLGRFKVTVAEDGGLAFVVAQSGEALAYQDTLEQRTQAALQQQSLPRAQFLWQESGVISPKPATASPSGPLAQDAVQAATARQQMAVFPSHGVSASVVMAGYTLARTVFELDNENRSQG